MEESSLNKSNYSAPINEEATKNMLKERPLLKGPVRIMVGHLLMVITS